MLGRNCYFSRVIFEHFNVMDLDIDFSSNLDWDPCYLALIFNVDFYDMSELWNSSSGLNDSELIEAMENFERNGKYVPLVEDISFDDDFLRNAVESIEHQ